jgi:hypothetical protein
VDEGHEVEVEAPWVDPEGTQASSYQGEAPVPSQVWVPYQAGAPYPDAWVVEVASAGVAYLANKIHQTVSRNKEKQTTGTN